MPLEAEEPTQTRTAEIPEQGELVSDQTSNDSDVQMEGPEEPNTMIDTSDSKLSKILEVQI